MPLVRNTFIAGKHRHVALTVLRRIAFVLNETMEQIPKVSAQYAA